MANFRSYFKELEPVIEHVAHSEMQSTVSDRNQSSQKKATDSSVKLPGSSGHRKVESSNIQSSTGRNQNRV